MCEDCEGPPNWGLIRTSACADTYGCCYKMVCANGCTLFCPHCEQIVYGYKMDYHLAKCVLCNNIFTIPHLQWHGNSLRENNIRYGDGDYSEEEYVVQTYQLCGCGNIGMSEQNVCELCYSVKVMLCLQKVGLPFDIVQLIMGDYIGKWYVMYPVRRLQPL
jgi:hypothetical protein